MDKINISISPTTGYSPVSSKEEESAHRKLHADGKNSADRVVIIGAGFAGLGTARALAGANIDIVVINKEDHHLFQPLLYQVASGSIDPATITNPLVQALAQQNNARFLQGTVVEIDKIGKKILLEDGQSLSYKYLVVAPGTNSSYFGHQEWQSHATGLKTLADAIKIKDQIRTSIQKAAASPSEPAVSKLLRFVIVGGGATGVEMAGAIAEIVKEETHRCHPKIHPNDVEVLLVQGGSQLLPGYTPDLAKVAHKELEKLGVKIRLNSRITEVARDSIRIDDEPALETVNVIWAAGNQAPEFLKTLQVPQDAVGRVKVENDLSILDHPEVFVIGDAAHVTGANGEPLQGLAPVAMQEGQFVAKIITDKIPKAQRSSFKYSDRGNIAVIATGKAVLKSGWLQLSGFFAWIVGSVVHLWYLEGIVNRLKVATQWLKELLFGRRLGTKTN